MLLVVPLLAAFEYVQLYDLFSSSSVFSFIQVNIFRIFFVAALRVFIDPLLHNFQVYRRRIFKWLKNKAEHDDFYEKFLPYFKHESKQDKLFYFHVGQQLETDAEVQIEGVILSLVSISSKTATNTARLAMPLLVFVFRGVKNYKENGLYTAFYDNQSTMSFVILGYYQLAVFGLFFLHIIVDALVIYLLDCIHTFNVYDYLKFCNFRFSRRKDNWLYGVSAEQDISLERSYRSLDALCFSDQYYFIIGLETWGVLHCVYGFQVIFWNGYNFFNDSLALPFIFLVLIVALLWRLFGSFLGNMINIWRRPKSKASKTFQLKLVLENYLVQNVNKFREEIVRGRFVKDHKPFVLQNLPNFVKKEDFIRDGGFLTKVYKNLEDITKKEDIEVVRKKLVEQNFYAAEPSPEDERKAVVTSSKNKFKRLLVLLQYWRILGREALYFKELVTGVEQQFKSSRCCKCRTSENLIVDSLITVYSLIVQFRVYLSGRMFSKEDWIHFYKEHQVFETICQNCRIIEDIKRYLKAMKQIKQSDTHRASKFLMEMDQQSSKEQTLYREIFKEQLNGVSKALLIKWLGLARARLVHFGPSELPLVQKKKDILKTQQLVLANFNKYQGLKREGGRDGIETKV